MSNSVCRVVTTLCVVTSLSTAAGCGLAAAPPSQGPPASGVTPSHVHAFAARLDQAFPGQVDVAGAVVTWREAGSELMRFDFSEAADRSVVRLYVDGVVLELPLGTVGAAIGDRHVAVFGLEKLFSAAIALKVAMAAARYLAQYGVEHTGTEFDRMAALRGMVNAMAGAAGGSADTAGWMSVAEGILSGSRSYSFLEIAQAAIRMLADIKTMVG